MVAFLAAAAVVLVLVLALVLRPLWHGARAVSLALAAAVVVSAAALYLLVGTPAALDPTMRAAPATLPEAIARLEAQLAQSPVDAEGWRLLGRAYTAEGEAAKARDALGRAATLVPDDPDVLSEAAQARAMADAQHRFDAQAIGWLRHALDVQPQHQRARWLLGVSQRQAGQAAEAAATWEPLLAQVDPQTAIPLREQIQAARKDAGLPPLPEPADAAPAQGALTVHVALDPQLAERVRLRGDATVFVIARAPGGSPMPIAVERRQVAELPLTVTLDDADSPMPTGKLSAQREVELVARVSASGNAMPQAGDLESAPVRVALPGKGPIELRIGHARD